MRRVLLIIAAVLIPHTPTYAANVVFDVDFNSMTVGDPPTEDGPPNSTSYVDAAGDAQCVVANSFGDLTDQPATLFDRDFQTAAGMSFSLADPIDQGKARVTWRACAGQIDHGGELMLGSGTFMEPFTIGLICFSHNGQMQVTYGDGEGGEEHALAGAYSVDTAVEFGLLIDLDAGQYDFLMNSEVVLSDLPFIDEPASIEIIHFGTQWEEHGNGLDPNTYGFDDFRVEWPTPIDTKSWGNLKDEFRVDQ